MSIENSNKFSKSSRKTDLPNSQILDSDSLNTAEEGTGDCYYAGIAYYNGEIACLDGLRNKCTKGNWVYLGENC